MQNNIFINLFDIYGKQFNLNVSGSEKIKTLVGSLIGFLSILVISSFCLFQIIGVLNKDVISVIYNESLIKTPVNNLTDYPIMFKVTDVTAKYIPPKGIYSFDSFLYVYEGLNGSQNKSLGSTKALPITIEPCNRDNHLGPYKNLFEKLDVENYHCIPRNKHNLTIYGHYGDLINGFSQLDIYISKCVNSTFSNEICESEETITQKTSRLFFIFAHVSNQIDHYNSTKPNQIKIQSFGLSFTSYILKRYVYYLIPIIYETDHGFLFEEKLQENFFVVNFESIAWDIDPMPAQIFIKKPQLASIHIKNTEATGYYYKSFVKFSNFIASVGGVIEFILVLCKILNYIFNRNVAFEKVINLIFKDEPTSVDDTTFFNNKNFLEKIKIAELDEVSKFSRRNYASNLKKESEKKEASNLNLKTKIKQRVASEMILNHPKILNKRSLQIEKFDKCKKLISSRLSLEYIMKQSYIFENYIKYFIDEAEITSKDFLLNLSQKISYKNLSLPAISEKADSITKYNLPNLEPNLEGGADKSHNALQSSTLNKLHIK